MRKQNIKNTIEKMFPCQVGFVKARVFDELRENLEKYQEKNHDLQIVENNINKRINPYLIYPDVQTIIVILFPYEKTDVDLRKATHVTSRSSWGIDYHIVLKEKLKKVQGFIKETYHKESVILTDDHPLHERHLAHLAGLGNYGKNTLMINPVYGSYFFISLILTDLDLDDESYDQPVLIDICKDCNRCLKACPTNAISESRMIDAKRCMSYLTQSKDEIPEEFLSKFTKFSFGCDFCQIACVYNSNIKLPVLEEFKPKGKEIIQVKDIEKLTNKTFKENYGSLAASFRGKNVLLRNVILVSANRKEYDDLLNIDQIETREKPYLKQAILYAKKKIDEGKK